MRTSRWSHEDSDGVDASGRPTNVHDHDAVAAAIDSSAAEFDRLDVVVNNGRTTSEGSEERTDVTGGNGEQ
jgi:NAD(P)-dependent dehydrogenase (short-subunit alcohol dehydrogenase family)